MRYHSCYLKHVYLPLFLTIALCSSGCGQSGTPVEYVRGVVTLDGTPLEGATVFFSPQGPEGMSAAGRTQSDGSFTLNAQGAKPGAGTSTGDYSVMISKVEVPEFVDLSTDDPRYGTREHELLQQNANSAEPTVIVPKKYNNSETSPFTAKVESGSNTFTFDVSSKED